MIIQNLSLRVPGRAALVDGTNWLVPRALLAVKDQALALRLQNFLRRLPNSSSFVGRAATAAQRCVDCCSVHK